MKEFLTLLVPAVLLLVVAVVLMGVKVFFVTGGRFPVSHVDGNPELARRGIRCAHHEDRVSAPRYPSAAAKAGPSASENSSQNENI